MNFRTWLRPLSRLNLRTQVAGFGLGMTLCTSLFIAVAGIWQGNTFNARALGEGKKLVQTDLDHITESVINLIKSQDMSVQEKVEDNLRVAKFVIEGLGKPRLIPGWVTWRAQNQFSGQASPVALDRLMIGSTGLGQNDRLDIPTPVVDQIHALVGGTVTLFQRMNPEGDMIRVATTVVTREGRRAIGTYIPVRCPDGNPNPVLDQILKGTPFRGVAYVVNAWYMTAYEPLLGARGEVIGMLYVGIRQERLESLRQSILKMKVGQTGYVYILGGKGPNRGRYILSRNGERDGEDIWMSRDSDNRFFIQSIVQKALALKPGTYATERYQWKNPGDATPHWKVAQIAYYEPWDWVIGVSTNEEELQAFLGPLAGSHRTMIRIIVLLAIAIAGLGGLMAWLLAGRISQPLSDLTEAARNIAAGNFSFRVAGGGSQEIQELAGAFRAMGTEVWRREHELQEAREAAEAASRAKSRFLASMGHELRTPLNAILLYSELLVSEAKDSGHLQCIPDLERIQVAARSLLEKISAILDFTNLENGKLEFHAQSFPLAAFLSQVSEVHRLAAEKKHLAFRLILDSGLPAQVIGDERHLRRLLDILLGNAVKFTDPGGERLGWVELECRVLDREEGQVHISFQVRDNGIGIPLETQLRIFQPFTQADDSSTRRFEGTGLNTAICARLTDLLGGAVALKSEPGRGSEFTVALVFPIANEALG